MSVGLGVDSNANALAKGNENRVRFLTGRQYWLAIALVAAAPTGAQFNQQQGTAPARGPDAPKTDPQSTNPQNANSQPAGAQTATPDANAPIVPDSEFNAACRRCPATSTRRWSRCPHDAPSTPPATTPPPPTHDRSRSSPPTARCPPPAAEDPRTRPAAAAARQLRHRAAADRRRLKDKDAPRGPLRDGVNGLDKLGLDGAVQGAVRAEGGRAARPRTPRRSRRARARTRRSRSG